MHYAMIKIFFYCKIKSEKESNILTEHVNFDFKRTVRRIRDRIALDRSGIIGRLN
jgi:hypothetical protein